MIRKIRQFLLVTSLKDLILNR